MSVNIVGPTGRASVTDRLAAWLLTVWTSLMHTTHHRKEPHAEHRHVAAGPPGRCGHWRIRLLRAGVAPARPARRHAPAAGSGRGAAVARGREPGRPAPPCGGGARPPGRHTTVSGSRAAGKAGAHGTGPRHPADAAGTRGPARRTRRDAPRTRRAQA